MSSTLARTQGTRARNSPRTYTLSSNDPNSNRKKPNLNPQRIFNTKNEAIDRNGICNSDMKPGVIITCSSAAYEILKKKSIYDYYQNSVDKTQNAQNIVSYYSALITEESMSIKYRDGSQNNTFYTTSKMDVNGYKLQQFVQNNC